MFGLTMDKIVVIVVIAAIVLGPDKLPAAATTLARFVRQLKAFTEQTKERVRDEVGPEFDEVDWTKFDPRRYDPRRIVRDAVQDVVAVDTLFVSEVAPVKGAGWRTPSQTPDAATDEVAAFGDEVRPDATNAEQSG